MVRPALDGSSDRESYIPAGKISETDSQIRGETEISSKKGELLRTCFSKQRLCGFTEWIPQEVSQILTWSEMGKPSCQWG